MKKALLLATVVLFVFAVVAPAFAAVDVDPIDASDSANANVTMTVPHVLVLHGPADFVFGTIQPGSGPKKSSQGFTVDSNEAWTCTASIADGVLTGVDDSGAPATIGASVGLSATSGAAGQGVAGPLVVVGVNPTWTTVPTDYSGVLILTATQD